MLRRGPSNPSKTCSGSGGTSNPPRSPVIDDNGQPVNLSNREMEVYEKKIYGEIMDIFIENPLKNWETAVLSNISAYDGQDTSFLSYLAYQDLDRHDA